MKPLWLVLTISTGLFVSMKGNRVVTTLYAVDLGAGPLETGILFALHGLFPAVMAVFAGRIADRFDNRLLMYVGITAYSLNFSLPYFFPSLTTLYLTAPLGGLTSLMFVVATQNLVGVLSTPQSRTRNYSYYSLGESFSNVLGPVLVGIGIDTVRHPLTFLFVALYSAIWGFVLYAGRNLIPPTKKPEGPQEKRQMKDLLAVPAMRRAMIVSAVVMTGLDLFNLYIPVYAHSLGISATVTGIIIGCFAAAAFVTRLALPGFTKRWGEFGVLYRALAVSGIAFVIFPLTDSAVLLGIAAFALGLGLGCGQPLCMLLAFNAAPPGRSAEGIAMRLVVSYGAHVVIPPVFGLLGAAAGVAPIFWTCALCMAIGSAMNRKGGWATPPAKAPAAEKQESAADERR